MAKPKISVRWDEVKPGDLIAHPWPSYRYLDGSLIEITSITVDGEIVKFITPAGGPDRHASAMVEVTREE
jgi:hypothetical protein